MNQVLIIFSFTWLLCLNAGASSSDEAKVILQGALDRSSQTYDNSPLCKQNSCPQLLENWLNNSKKKGIAGRLGFKSSPYSQCHKRPSAADPVQSPQQLAQDYKSNSSIKLGALNKSQLQSCISGSDYDLESQKLMINKYYSTVFKLDESSKAYLQEIAAIDNLFGDPILKSTNCKKPMLPSSEKTCKQAKAKCSAKKNQWAPFLKASKKTYSNYKKLLAKYKEAKKAFSKAREFDINPKQTQLLKNNTNQLKDLISQMQRQNSWLVGKAFKKNVTKNFESALKKQLKANRRTLQLQYYTSARAASCMNTKNIDSEDGRNCSLQLIDKTLKHTPNYISSGPVTSNSKQSSIDQQLKEVQCIDENRSSRDQSDKVITHVARDVALFTLTAGVPALAARGLLLTHRGARATMAAIDGVYASTSAHEASQVCGNEYLKANQKIDEFTCSTLKSESVSKYDECFQSKMFAALDLMPFVPLGLFKGLRKSFNEKEVLRNASLSNSDRLQMASNILKRKLSANEKKAILKAHDIGSPDSGVYNYSLDEQKKKLDALIAAGFSKAERKALMRSGITGAVSAKRLSLAELKALHKESPEKFQDYVENRYYKYYDDYTEVAESLPIAFKEEIDELVEKCVFAPCQPEKYNILELTVTSENLERVKNLNNDSAPIVINIFKKCADKKLDCDQETADQVLNFDWNHYSNPVEQQSLSEALTNCIVEGNGKCDPTSEFLLLKTVKTENKKVGGKHENPKYFQNPDDIKVQNKIGDNLHATLDMNVVHDPSHRDSSPLDNDNDNNWWKKLMKQEGILPKRAPDYAIEIDGYWQVFDFYNPQLSPTRSSFTSLSRRIAGTVLTKSQVKGQAHRILVNFTDISQLSSNPTAIKSIIKEAANLIKGKKNDKVKIFDFEVGASTIDDLPAHRQKPLKPQPFTSLRNREDLYAVQGNDEKLKDVFITLGTLEKPIPVRIYPTFNEEHFDRALRLTNGFN